MAVDGRADECPSHWALQRLRAHVYRRNSPADYDDYGSIDHNHNATVDHDHHHVANNDRYNNYHDVADNYHDGADDCPDVANDDYYPAVHDCHDNDHTADDYHPIDEQHSHNCAQFNSANDDLYDYARFNDPNHSPADHEHDQADGIDRWSIIRPRWPDHRSEG